MQSVSSNAVYNALGGKRIKVISDTYTINSGYFTVNPQMADANYMAFVQKTYTDATGYFFTVQQYSATTLYVYVRTNTNGIPANGTSIKVNVLIFY